MGPSCNWVSCGSNANGLRRRVCAYSRRNCHANPIGWLAAGFGSSSPICPATQSSQTRGPPAKRKVRLRGAPESAAAASANAAYGSPPLAQFFWGSGADQLAEIGSMETRVAADATTTLTSPRLRRRVLLANRIRPGHLEGKAETGQIFARMIIGVRELRNAKIQWPRFLALIDCGIEVDEVPARRGRSSSVLAQLRSARTAWVLRRAPAASPARRVPARAVRACGTVSWRPPEIPEAINPIMGRRG